MLNGNFCKWQQHQPYHPTFHCVCTSQTWQTLVWLNPSAQWGRQGNQTFHLLQHQDFQHTDPAQCFLIQLGSCFSVLSPGKRTHISVINIFQTSPHLPTTNQRRLVMSHVCLVQEMLPKALLPRVVAGEMEAFERGRCRTRWNVAEMMIVELNI